MAKKALGKGLGSLMGTAEAETAAMEPDSTLPLSKIVPNKDQPRKLFKPEELAELSDSISQNGVLQPLLVRKKGMNYEIVAGERRYQAAKLAGLKEVPVIIKDISDDEVFKLALIENLQRSDLSPLEEARGYKQLIKERNLTQEHVEQGLITAGHARAILSVPSEEGRIKLAKKVVDNKLSVRQTENLAPLFSVTEQEVVHRTPTPQSFKRAARQLRLALDTNVKVKNVRGKNKIEIEFNSEEDLAELVDKLTSMDGEQ